MNHFFIFTGLILLLWFAALLYLRSYVGRRTDPGYLFGKLEEDIRKLEAIILEETEQALVLLEDKIKELKEISTEAEKRIALHIRELNKRGDEKTAFAALGREPPREKQAGKTQPKNRGKSLLDSIEVREAMAETAANAYKTEGAAARTPPAVGPPVPAVPSGSGLPDEESPLVYGQIRLIRSENPVKVKPPPLRERISELHLAGFSTESIAARLGITVTEAELYIALEKGKK